MSGTIRWLDLAAMKATAPPPVEWVVEPLLARGCLTMLVGAYGVLKSMLATAVASAVACEASSLGGMAVDGGQVILLDAENGEAELHRRAHLADLPPDRVRAGIAEGFDLRRPAAIEELRAVVEEVGAALVVLDGLASLAPGLKENEADQAGPVLDRLRRLAHSTDAAYLLLHHGNKSGEAWRGGTAIPAAVDVAASLLRPRDSDDPELRVLDWGHEKGGKMRVGPQPEPRHLRFSFAGGHLTVDAAEPSDVADAPKRTSSRDALRDEAVAHVADHGPATQADLLRAIGRTPQDRTGRRALEDALAAGELVREDGLYSLDVGGGSNGATPATATCHSEAGVGGRQAPVGGPATCHPATPEEEAEVARLMAKHPDLAGGA